MNVAAASKAWYVAMQYSSGAIRIFRSADGAARWSDITPGTFKPETQLAVGYPLQLMTAVGGHAYLLGVVGTPYDNFTSAPKPLGGVKVWASGSSGFDHVYSIPIAAQQYAPVAVTSGTRCVYATVAIYPSFAQERTINPGILQLDTWSICQGRLSAQPIVLNINPKSDLEWSAVSLGMANGQILLSANGFYELKNGRWHKAPGTLFTAPLLSNGSSLVDVGLGFGGAGAAYSVISRSGVKPHSFPPGQLPDAGVADRNREDAVAACAGPMGYVVGGYTIPPGGSWVAALWWSRDGSLWNKMSVRGNRLQTMSAVIGLGCSGSHLLVLLKAFAGQSERFYVWLGDLAR